MGSSSPSKTTTTVKLPEQSRTLLNTALPTLTDFVKNPPTPWQGTVTQPFAPAELMAQQATMQQAQGVMPQLANSAANASMFLSGPAAFAYSNPYLQSYMAATARPLLQAYEQQLIPQVDRAALTNDQYGSSRHGIMAGMAGQATMDALASALSKLASEGYNQGLDAMVRSQALAPGIGMMQLQAPSAMAGVGEQQRTLAQAMAQEQEQRYMYEKMLPYLVAREAAGLAYGAPNMSATSIAPNNQPPLAVQSLGGALSGAGVGSMIGGPAGALIGGGIGAITPLLFRL